MMEHQCSDETHLLLRFEWSVRALAQDSDVQISLFPHFVCVADELALDFEKSLNDLHLSNIDFTPEESASILRLDAHILAISGPEHEDLWTDDGLRKSAEWCELRRLARQLLEVTEWSTEAPPTDRAIYAGPDA